MAKLFEVMYEIKDDEFSAVAYLRICKPWALLQIL